MSNRRMAPNKIMREAHRRGLPVHTFVREIVAHCGGPAAAARHLDVAPSTIRRYTEGKTHFATRLIALADSYGMDTAPFVLWAVEAHGTPTAAAQALGVSVCSIYTHMNRSNGPSPRRVPLTTKVRLMQLLNEGMPIADAARCVGVQYNVASYYSRKTKRITAKLRRAA